MSFFRHTLAISNGKSAGAARRGARGGAPRGRAAASLPSGSPNTRAATAEASTTLTGIPVGADHGGGLGWGAQPESPDLTEKIVRAQPLFEPHRGLQDGQKLALERTMMTAGPLAQPPHDLIR